MHIYHVVMKTTTIQIDEHLKKELDEIKMFKRETYNDIIERLLEDFKELNKQTRKQILSSKIK